MPIDRIVLGTAQLGLPYGRRREENAMPAREAHAILEAAWDLGIRAFDTAESYGAAPKQLAYWLSRNDRIAEADVVTKISPTDAVDSPLVRAACGRFAGARSITILSHGSVDAVTFGLFSCEGEQAGATAGQSVYTPTEVERAAKAGAALVQAPANVFDSRQLAAAHRAGVPIDARSVFLQGVLLDEPARAEQRAPGAGSLAEAVQASARSHNIDPAAVLIASVLRLLRPCDRVVIGLDDVDQLQSIERSMSMNAAVVADFCAAVSALRAPALARGTLDPTVWS